MKRNPKTPAARPRDTLSPARQEALLRSDVGRATLDPTHVKQELQRLAKERRKLDALACSSTWAEDCWERGVPYAPAAKCFCANCKGRRKFPALYVRNGISYERWIEARVEALDADLAAALAPLGYAARGPLGARAPAGRTLLAASASTRS